ncbi:hypothetical protein SAMN04489860_2249 [Paraoerskovia marina]|uniref:Heavy metal transporter n=1 Tax=Paraoerskovia marina TaxID=545619 RepID=A0A1H1UNB2_9CELL|nr:hypothetical protein [Paraoerskovia marina]SDS74022.1 hypothetical protein SAMN04489860_2249 [Paraoerskovia marina]
MPGFGRVAATAVAVGALAMVAVVAALNRLDAGDPVADRCSATAEGTSWNLSPVQTDNAALIGITAVERGLPARAATIGIATGLQESKLVNIDYGDRDSLGLFQQRPSQGWGSEAEILDPVYSTNAFYDVLETIDGYETLDVTDAAQRVQRSAFPLAYAQHETRSRAWASALSGYSEAALTCELAAVENPTGETTALVERIDRDLGDAPREVDGDTVTVDTEGFGGTTARDRVRTSWAVAQWAVATAQDTDADAVTVDGHRWTRSSPTWEEIDGGPAPGQVEIRVAPAPHE